MGSRYFQNVLPRTNDTHVRVATFGQSLKAGFSSATGEGLMSFQGSGAPQSSHSKQLFQAVMLLLLRRTPDLGSDQLLV